MQEPTFDLFMGESEKDAIWLEKVHGLSKAKDRMEQLAAHNPGQYFVFCLATHSVMARRNTFKQPQFP